MKEIIKKTATRVLNMMNNGIKNSMIKKNASQNILKSK